jgi:hypothetical protein
MKKVQSNRVNMIEAVLSYLIVNTAAAGAAAGLTEAMDKIKELLEAIWVKDTEKQKATTGKSVKKKKTKELLCIQAVKVADGLFLWSKKNENIEMKAFSSVTRSHYSKKRDAHKINFAKALCSAAAGKDMNFAGVKEADVTKLSDLANEFKKDIGGLSTGAANRIAVGHTLDQIINETMNQLKEDLDKYMQIYSDENPELYSGYKAARVLWDKGVRHNGETSAPMTPPQPPI